MTLEKNIERMFWRLSNGAFTPNQNDVKAMTEIVEWINRQKQQSIHEQYLFAKLYCHVFIQEIEYYKDTKYAQRKIHEYLKFPIIGHYELFLEKLNFYETMKFSRHIGLCEKHPLLKTETEEQNDKELLKKHEAEYMKHVKGLWTYEQVEKGLNNQITEAINHYKNLP
jgi:hypothetical protein